MIRRVAMVRMLFSLAIASLAVAAPLATQAYAASDLNGSSLDLSWTEELEVVHLGRGIQQSTSVNIHLLLYVGTKGRFFTKVNAVNHRGEDKERDFIAGEGGDNSSWQWQLTPSGITGFGRVGRSGARRVTVVLQGGGRCSMTAALARKVGEDAIVKRNRNGKKISIVSDRPMNMSCTLRAGNVFAL